MDKESELFKRGVFLQNNYTPHFGQEEIHFTDWTYFVCCWGRRSGKTHAAAQEAIAALATPDMRTWVVAPNYSLCDKVFREVWQAVCIDGVLGDPNKVITHKRMDPRGGTMVIRTAWGSWIEGKSADSPASLVGEGLDLLIMDEAAKINSTIWEKYLEPTLLDRKGRVLMISTPEGHNWFYEVYTRGQDEETRAKGWKCSQFKSEQNPHLDSSWIHNKKSEVTPEIYRQEYEASFEHHTGLVWPEYRDHLYPHGHLFNDTHMTPNTSHNHYRSIDPGLKNPTACIWPVVVEGDDVYITQDYEVADVLADSHAANINVQTRFKITQTYIGHDAARQSPTDGVSVADVYRENGIYAIPAPRDVGAGIQIVARYLRATLEDKPSHPRLFIHENCRQLRIAINQYIWDEHSALTDKNSPDKPRKRNDHLCDTLRQFLSTEPHYVRPFREEEVMKIQPRRPPTRPGRPSTGL